MLKTAEKLNLDKNEVKSKMGFRACNSKGVDKNGAKCNMAGEGFRVFTVSRFYGLRVQPLHWEGREGEHFTG